LDGELPSLLCSGIEPHVGFYPLYATTAPHVNWPGRSPFALPCISRVDATVCTRLNLMPCPLTQCYISLCIIYPLSCLVPYSYFKQPAMDVSDPVETYANKLKCFSNTASAIQAQCDSLIEQASNQGIPEAVVKRWFDRKIKETYPTPPSSNQSVPRHSPSSNTSVSLASNGSLNRKKHSYICVNRAQSCTDEPRPPATPRFRILKNPKVVIRKSNRIPLPLQQVSQLQSRAVTESWEDGEIENQVSNPQAISGDSSEDELLHDPRRPVAQSGSVAHPKPTKPPKSQRQRRLPRPTIRALESTSPASQFAHQSPIDWAFWIQVSNEIGYWRPLPDFPSAKQVQFKRKFDTDFLQTPRHIRLWMQMLRNRETYLDRDICVGNMAYWGRNEPSKWSKARGDKEKTCDTCFRAGRFCARMVKVGDVVMLGFFPALDAGETAVDWRKIRHWSGEKKRPERKGVASRE
jgi:hypothetical protein